MRNPDRIWNAERSAFLEKLWVDGIPGQEIADAIGNGVSYHAVKRKAARLGLPKRPPENSGKRKYPERDAEILRRWDERESSGAIAEAMGITRSTVIGAVCRAGKQRGEIGAPQQRKGGREGAARQRRQRRAVTLAPRPPEMPVVVKLPPAPPLADLDIPISQRCGIHDLTAITCRWPVGDPGQPDFFFCGGPALSGQPYCSHHSRRAVQPLRSPSERIHLVRQFGRIRASISAAVSVEEVSAD